MHYRSGSMWVTSSLTYTMWDKSHFRQNLCVSGVSEVDKYEDYMDTLDVGSRIYSAALRIDERNEI